MHRAKQAVIMAAGQGTRLRPLTERIPKPLIPVHGERMIENLIAALHENDISEIYVVTGYLKEQFRFLEETYQGLHLLENPEYAASNNISSLYTAREHLQDAVILDADQLILDRTILKPEFERSCYCCTRVSEPVTEWVLQEREGVVCGCSRTGGASGWQLYGVSFWTAQDGRRLKEHVEAEFARSQSRGLYWDDIALFCHPEAYSLGIRKIRKGTLVEIDSLEELAAIDAAFGKERK